MPRDRARNLIMRHFTRNFIPARSILVRSANRRILLIARPLAFLVALTACSAVPEIPESLDVATSATDQSPAAPGSGPVALADSTWSLTRRADPDHSSVDDAASPGPYGRLLSGQGLQRPPVGVRMFVARFGSHGEMVEITDNQYFLARIYGATVPVGGEWTAATLPGVHYRSASFGVQVADRIGIAVLVDVRYSDNYLGRAILYSWGALANDRIDGAFGYLLDFSGGALENLGMIVDQYPIDGQRL